MPYAKPGLPLTREILSRMESNTQVIILQNHGLICAGDSVEEVIALIADVEKRLALIPRSTNAPPATDRAPEGFVWSAFGWLTHDEIAYTRATSGIYYPDHVVFLGPCLPTQNHDGNPSAILQKGQGVLIKPDATPSQLAICNACLTFSATFKTAGRLIPSCQRQRPRQNFSTGMPKNTVRP